MNANDTQPLQQEAQTTFGARFVSIIFYTVA